MISVIIVLKKPTKFLEKNLFYFSKQKNKKFEVILISENDIEINQNFNFKLKTLKSKTNLPGPKRHLGAENAQGEILAFIDDDCKVDKNWLTNISKLLKKSDADVITGPQLYEHNYQNNHM